MSKLTKPLLGVFAGVTPTGYIWYDTIRYRARDARAATGHMMEGRRLKDGRTIDNHAAGWALAKSEGFRVERVDVLPAARSALGEQPEVKE